MKINKDKFSDIEIYLLRNFPFSGVGFRLQWSGFYPDFILWLKKNEKQAIVFIDPKGLEHTKGLDDEKIVFAGKSIGSGLITIKDIESKLGNSNVVLESFILSVTPYKQLIEEIDSPPAKEEYIAHHVLFLEDENWVEKLFSNLNL